MLSGLMTELLGLKNVRHNYERKLILVGLSQMLLASNLPQELAPFMQQIVNEMVDLTNKLIKSKEKEQASKAKREMEGNEEDDSESDDDDSDDAESDDGDEG